MPAADSSARAIRDNASASPVPGRSPNPAPLLKPTAKRSAPDDRWAIVLVVLIPIVLTVWHLRYYLAPAGARLRDPLHAALKPSVGLGLQLGVVGFALFLFMWLYPMRKQARWLAWTGPLGEWMRIHVVAGIALPLLVAVHAGWRFDGLIGLGYLSMVVVCLSGVVGRYLYVRIPRSRSGLELSIDEVSGERRALLTDIAVATGLAPAEVERALAIAPRSYAGLDPLRVLVRMAQDDMARARALATLKREWSRPRPGAQPIDKKALDHALRLARHEMALNQQVRVLEVTRKIFGYWHVAHRPFAITALIAVVVHVVVAIVIGGVAIPGWR